VNLLHVFRRKGKLYLVFEHVDHTILEDLEKHPNGLSDHRDHGVVRKVMFQLLKAVDYLHSHNVISMIAIYCVRLEGSPYMY
jgi:cyclin-dependent kinase-like